MTHISQLASLAIIYKNYLSFMNFYFDDDSDGDDDGEYIYKKIVGNF